jgi:hypothetical protein
LLHQRVNKFSQSLVSLGTLACTGLEGCFQKGSSCRCDRGSQMTPTVQLSCQVVFKSQLGIPGRGYLCKVLLHRLGFTGHPPVLSCCFPHIHLAASPTCMYDMPTLSFMGSCDEVCLLSDFQLLTLCLWTGIDVKADAQDTAAHGRNGIQASRCAVKTTHGQQLECQKSSHCRGGGC